MAPWRGRAHRSAESLVYYQGLSTVVERKQGGRGLFCAPAGAASLGPPLGPGSVAWVPVGAAAAPMKVGGWGQQHVGTYSKPHELI